MTAMLAENFLNLEEAVKTWAKGEYDALANKKQKRLRDKESSKPHNYLNITIDWSEVINVDKTLKFPLMDDMKGKKPSPDANKNEAPSLGDAGGAKSGLAGSAKATTSVLFRTKFQNKTDRLQEYTMKTEKTTKSSFMVETESGYTKGFDLSVTLQTPGEVFQANAGYHREYSLTNITGESFEEELNWGVESVIKVKSNHEAQAQLVVFERKKKGTFTVETQISGRVYVNFTNIRDNNSFVMATSEDICTILEEHVTAERKHGKAMDFIRFTKKPRAAHVITKGTCKFAYGIRQEVKVSQKKLKASDLTTSGDDQDEDDDDDDDDDDDE